jgi:hypothetical protein
MNKTTIISSAITILFFAACSTSTTNTESKDAKIQDADSGRVFNVDTTTLAAGTPYYVCWMHPELISNKPGNCPECGEMVMEEKIKQ